MRSPIAGRVSRAEVTEGNLVQAGPPEATLLTRVVSLDPIYAYFDGDEQTYLAFRELARSGDAENQRRTFQVVEDRLEAGRGTAFDAERARAQLGLTLAAIPSIESQIAAAQYRIGVLVARSPEQVATELADARELPALPATVPVTSPDSLIRQRPDVVSAERRLAAQTRDP